MNDNNQSLFQLTQGIVEEIEAHILNSSHSTPIGKAFSQHLVFPAKYMNLGAGEVIKPLGKWASISTVLFIFFLIIFRNSDLPAEILKFILAVCFYAPMFIVIFSIPSTYAFFGIKNKNITAVTSYLSKIEINSKEKIELLEANIEIIDKRISGRVSAFKWTIATCWAIFTYFMNQTLSISLKANPENWQSIFIENLFSLITFALVSLLALWAIVGYKRASDYLIKCIEFGCVEMKYNIINDNKKSQQ